MKPRHAAAGMAIALALAALIIARDLDDRENYDTTSLQTVGPSVSEIAHRALAHEKRRPADAEKTVKRRLQDCDAASPPTTAWSTS